MRHRLQELLRERFGGDTVDYHLSLGDAEAAHLFFSVHSESGALRLVAPELLEAEVRAGGFREDLVNSEDWDFWGRIALTGARLVPVAYVGALYRRHALSQVATTPKPAIFKGRLTVAETLAVHSGSNTISYKFDTTDTGNVNLDNLAVTAATTTPTNPPGSVSIGTETIDVKSDPRSDSNGR